MTEKYKILGKFIKDLSSETKDVETYIFVKDNISKYQLGINISSRALKNKMIEVSTILKFEDKEPNQKKSYFEINFSTIVKINDDIKDKKELEKIILCDVQIEIYPNLEKSLLDLLHNSGYPEIKFEKKIDFENLYTQRISARNFVDFYDLIYLNVKEDQILKRKRDKFHEVVKKSKRIKKTLTKEQIKYFGLF